MKSSSYHWSSKTFEKDFEAFDHNGIKSPDVGECAILTSWMYDYIDNHFFDWSCHLLEELRKYNDETVAMRPGSFIYLGHVFTPYKKLKGVEASFDYISSHTTYDYLGERLKPEWCYEDFYEASTDKECDVFKCDGMLWIPGARQLFRWSGEKE